MSFATDDDDAVTLHHQLFACGAALCAA